ncbi:MFS transporter [Kitasatospora indigofera]|uniref:MFS transporter n=1 Tax=Kitasatospora indigofera TaxID=67307 RepID=UPI0033B8DF42
MSSTTRSLPAARLSTFGFFALNGFLMGIWVVHIPAVEARAGVSHAVLGWLLLLLGGGAFAGMRATGPLTDRFGARTVVPATAGLCSAALVLPGLATGPFALAAALLVFGFGIGCLDVSMNTHAVQVERGYRRPVMSAFHAVYSVGGVLAALAGARTLSWGWSPAATLAGVSLLGLLMAALAAPALLPPDPAPARDGGDGGDGGPGHPAAGSRRRTPSRIWALAALALMLMLSEGVANDWSVLALRDVLGAPAATAAFAYGAFSTAMTLGRLAGDRVAGRFGPVAVVRYGSAVAAAGLTTAALAGSVPLALAGWTLFGIGLSGGVPQLFSAAGHADRDHAGANVSRVAGLGYLGMLAGPAVIGPLTRVMPLNLAFFLPVALCVTAACAASLLRPGPAAPGRDVRRVVPGEGAEAAVPGAGRPATGSVPEPR